MRVAVGVAVAAVLLEFTAPNAWAQG